MDRTYDAMYNDFLLGYHKRGWLEGKCIFFDARYKKWHFEHEKDRSGIIGGALLCIRQFPVPKTSMIRYKGCAMRQRSSLVAL